MSDLVALRAVLLQSRTELDEAVQQWELDLKNPPQVDSLVKQGFRP